MSPIKLDKKKKVRKQDKEKKILKQDKEKNVHEQDKELKSKIAILDKRDKELKLAIAIIDTGWKVFYAANELNNLVRRYDIAIKRMGNADAAEYVNDNYIVERMQDARNSVFSIYMSILECLRRYLVKQ